MMADKDIVVNQLHPHLEHLKLFNVNHQNSRSDLECQAGMGHD